MNTFWSAWLAIPYNNDGFHNSSSTDALATSSYQSVAAVEFAVTPDFPMYIFPAFVAAAFINTLIQLGAVDNWTCEAQTVTDDVDMFWARYCDIK